MSDYEIDRSTVTLRGQIVIHPGTLEVRGVGPLSADDAADLLAVPVEVAGRLYWYAWIHDGAVRGLRAGHYLLPRAATPPPPDTAP